MTQRHPILTSDAHLNVLRHWMAPEVLLRQQFSVRSDVYSLCCVMWELCNRKLAASAENEFVVRVYLCSMVFRN